MLKTVTANKVGYGLKAGTHRNPSMGEKRIASEFKNNMVRNLATNHSLYLINIAGRERLFEFPGDCSELLPTGLQHLSGYH